MKLGIRELVFFLVLLGLLGSAYWFGFKRMDTRRESLEASIKVKQTALGDLRRSTAGIEDVEQKLKQLSEAIRFFESKLPQERELETILDQVWKIAQRHNLTTRSVKTLRTERNPSYSEQQLQIGLSGNFEGYYAFLLEFEKLPRITRITKMNLQKINDTEGQMQADITLSIYFESDGRNNR